MCIIVSNEPKYCACLYVYNVLYVYNCIHEKAIKPSCILYLGKIKPVLGRVWVTYGAFFSCRGDRGHDL